MCSFETREKKSANWSLQKRGGRWRIIKLKLCTVFGEWRPPVAEATQWVLHKSIHNLHRNHRNPSSRLRKFNFLSPCLTCKFQLLGSFFSRSERDSIFISQLFSFVYFHIFFLHRLFMKTNQTKFLTKFRPSIAQALETTNCLHRLNERQNWDTKEEEHCKWIDEEISARIEVDRKCGKS